MSQTLTQFPKTILPLFRFLNGSVRLEIAVVDPFAPKPRMQKISPGDDTRYYEKFCPKRQPSTIKNMHGRNHSFAGFDQQLVAANAKARLWVYVRPRCKKIA